MLRRRSCLLALVLAFVPSILTGQDWIGRAGFAAEVRGHKKGPVPGARVDLEFLSGDLKAAFEPLLTDSKGRITVTGLAVGSWRIQISHPEYMTYIAVLDMMNAGPPRERSAFQQATPDSLVPMRIKFDKPPKKALTPALVLDLERSDPVALPAAEQVPEEPDPTLAPVPAAPAAPAPAKVPPPEPQPEASEPPPAPRDLTPVPPPPAAPEAEPAPPPDPPRTEPEPGAETPLTLDDDAVPEPAPAESAPPAPPAAPEPVPEPAAEPLPAPAPLPEPDAVVEPGATAIAEVEPEPEVEPVPRPSVEAAVEPAPEPAPPLAEVVPRPEAEPTPEPVPAPDVATQEVPDPTPAADVAIRERPALSPSLLRAYKDRTCFECGPGEWALSTDADPGAADPGECAADWLYQLSESFRAVAASEALGAETYLGPIVGIGSPALDGIDLPDSPPGCSAVAALLPPGARFVGFRFEALAGETPEGCVAAQDCPTGDLIWPENPRIERGDAGTLVWAVLRATGPDSAGRLTVYFRPSAGWSPPR